MKITDQISAIDRAVIIITDGSASPELSEFFEHIENRINLSKRDLIIKKIIKL